MRVLEGHIIDAMPYKQEVTGSSPVSPIRRALFLTQEQGFFYIPPLPRRSATKTVAAPQRLGQPRFKC